MSQEVKKATTEITPAQQQTILLMDFLAAKVPKEDTPEAQEKLEEFTKGLIRTAAKLMPTGEPDFDMTLDRPTLSRVINRAGAKETFRMIANLLEDFNNSVNVVRPMNSLQITECAMFLITERHSLRLEDYVMLFAMAKRGKLGKIMDRLDIETISRFKEEYEAIRYAHGERNSTIESGQKESLYEEPKNPAPVQDFSEILSIYKQKKLEHRADFVNKLESRPNKAEEVRQKKIDNLRKMIEDSKQRGDKETELLCSDELKRIQELKFT